MMFRTPLIAAALIALPMFATAAAAQQTVTGEISYADLDLGSPAGRAALEARVDATIARLTAPEDYRDLKQLQQSAQMSAAMHASATAQLAPVLARAETSGGGVATGALRK
mgnify:FL=1